MDSTNGAYSASLAVDGIKTTAASRWVSTNSTSTHWFQLDWSAAQTIRSVKVWSGFPGSNKDWQIRDYSIQSWNGSAWVTLGMANDNLEDAFYGQYDWISFPPVTTSRLRLFITQGSSSDNTARLAEIEVY